MNPLEPSLPPGMPKSCERKVPHLRLPLISPWGMTSMPTAALSVAISAACWTWPISRLLLAPTWSLGKSQFVLQAPSSLVLIVLFSRFFNIVFSRFVVVLFSRLVFSRLVFSRLVGRPVS